MYPHCPFSRRNSAFLAFASSSAARELGRARQQSNSSYSSCRLGLCVQLKFNQQVSQTPLSSCNTILSGLKRTSNRLPGLARIQIHTSPALLYITYKKLKNFILGFLPGTTLPPTLQSSVKVDIMSPSQHKQDNLSVSSVLSAVSAVGHEDVEGTGQKTGWEFLKCNSVLNFYEKTDCPRAGRS